MVAFDKPLRQGNTTYPYIIFQFKKDLQTTLEMQLPLEQLQKINPEIKDRTVEGDYYKIVANLFKLVIGISIIQPGEDFRTHSGFSGLKCNFKQQEGLLFPLNKSLIFIKKPVISIRYEDIARVEFQRVSAGSVGVRNFDFKIVLKKGYETEFTSADRKDFEALKELFIKRKVEVKEEDDRQKNKRAVAEDDEDDDDEGASIHSEGDEEEGEEEEDEDFVDDEGEGMEENEDYDDKKKPKKR